VLHPQMGAEEKDALQRSAAVLREYATRLSAA
jgi:hypothetical protein